MPVSRDIVSPYKTIRGMNKSIPRMEYTGIEYPLKTKIRHRNSLLMLNIAVSMYTIRTLLRTTAIIIYLW